MNIFLFLTNEKEHHLVML